MNLSSDTTSVTFSHEIVAQEEAKVGVFFSAFAIQYLLNAKTLKVKNLYPTYIRRHYNVELYAAQRVFIKKILDNPDFKDIIEEMSIILTKYTLEPVNLPEQTLLEGKNKSFLIRQIFKKTSQILPKYNFIDYYVGINLRDFNFNKLAKDMETFSIEEKILILARIFDKTGDLVNRNKSILESFKENAAKIKEELNNKGKSDGIEYANISLFLDFE